jgi:hypothetical protein
MPDYSKDPLFTPVRQWQQDPSPGNASAMLKALEPAITSAIRTNVGEAGENIRSRARLMALDTMGRYDPSRAKISTYLTNQFQGLRRHVRREQTPVHFPEAWSWERNRILEASREMEDELGRPPLDEEIADRMGIPPNRLRRSLRSQAPLASGQFATPEGEVILPPVMQQRTNLWLDLIRDDLAPVDRFIFDSTLGWKDAPALSNLEIAKRLRLSPGAISQRKAKIQALLDKQPEEF